MKRRWMTGAGVIALGLALGLALAAGNRRKAVEASVTMPVRSDRPRAESAAPFWQGAEVSEPPVPREARTMGIVIPADAGDPAAAVAEAERLDPSPEHDRALNLAVHAWFSREPERVRTWLEECPSLERCQPVLQWIASGLAVEGKPGLALEWSRLIDDAGVRERVVADILATGYRNGEVDEAAVRGAALPEELRQAILAGARSD